MPLLCISQAVLWQVRANSLAACWHCLCKRRGQVERLSKEFVNLRTFIVGLCGMRFENRRGACQKSKPAVLHCETRRFAFQNGAFCKLKRPVSGDETGRFVTPLIASHLQTRRRPVGVCQKTRVWFPSLSIAVMPAGGCLMARQCRRHGVRRVRSPAALFAVICNSG